MKIGTRLVVGFSICILFLLLLGCVGIFQIKSSTSRANAVIEVDTKIVESAQRLRANINMMRRYEKDAFINMADPAKVDEYVKKWQDARERGNKRLEALNKLEKEPKDLQTLADITKSMEAYESGFKKVVALVKSGTITSTQDANKAIGEYKQATHKAEKEITDYASSKDENFAKVKKEFEAAESRAITITIAVMCISLLVVFLVITLLIRSIKRPLHNIQRMVHDLAKGDGDLSVRLPEGKDEIGEICGCFNVFLEKLHGIVSKVARSAVQVASASSQLHTTAEQIAGSSEEVVSQTNTVAMASKQMSSTTNDIAHNCLSAAENSQRACETAQSGATVVQQTIQGMDRIASRVRDAAKTVEDLGARSEQIGAIIGTIEDIADQTNLLALNAAIEAARAGEQGRGFAVVADEVRALAERTTRATHEIGEMIKGIQRETKGAVNAMEEGVGEVEKGTEASVKSGQALELILSQINDVTMQVNQIATAAEEQTATTMEITSNIQQVTQIVLTTAKGATDTASASSQLSSEAENLQQLVCHFKL